MFQRVRGQVNGDKPSLWSGFVVAFLFAVAVPCIVYMLVPNTPNGGIATGPLAISVLTGVNFAVVVASRARRPFEMVTWVFAYVFLGIAPLVQIRMDIDPATTLGLDRSLMSAASLIVLVGCFSISVGSLLGKLSGALGTPGERKGGIPSRSVSANRAKPLALISLALFMYYTYEIGIGNLFLSRTDLSVLKDSIWPDKTLNALITASVSMGLLVSMIALMNVKQQQGKFGNELPSKVLLGIVFVSLTIAVNPVSTPRYIFGTAALALLAAAGMYSSLARFRAVSVGFASSLVFIFPALDSFRNSLDSTIELKNPLLALTTGDFDAFAQIVNTVEFVALRGITWGNQALGVVFFWVPRSMWPEKASDTGTLLAEMKGYWFKNLSAPLWAEMFINGGWLALVLGMLAFGFGLRRWDLHVNGTLSLNGTTGVLGCILPFYMLMVLRGSLLQSVSYMAVILVCSWFATTRHQGGSASPAAGTNSVDAAVASHPLPRGNSEVWLPRSHRAEAADSRD